MKAASATVAAITHGLTLGFHCRSAEAGAIVSPDSAVGHVKPPV
jgi:hypothetical protein